MPITLGIFIFFALCVAGGLVHAITADQLDDFEDGTVMGWQEGANSPNPPVNVGTGGPGGVDDNYLENVSDGGGTAGRAMVNSNLAQWTGDYVAVGVDSIEVAMANLGATTLQMRIALQGAGQSRFASMKPAEVPADGVWRTYVFGLTVAELTQIAGSNPLEEVLANVTEVRILHNDNPSWTGDAIVAVLGLDNIRALSSASPVEPTSWGWIKRSFRME